MLAAGNWARVNRALNAELARARKGESGTASLSVDLALGRYVAAVQKPFRPAPPCTLRLLDLNDVGKGRL